MTAETWLAFLVAAGLGAPARYLLDGWVQDRTGHSFPWGTFAVITGLGLYHGVSPAVRTVIGTGGMGAYTTFSTFTFETVRLAEEGSFDDALRNALDSVAVGLAAASTGLALAAVF